MISYADIFITNASVYTVDPRNPVAEAVAIRGSRIAFVGSDADAAELRGPETVVIDAQGKSLLPGFIDSHYHLLWGSLWLAAAQLRTAENLDQMMEQLHAWADANPEQEWIIGRQVVYSIIHPQQPLNRHLLDRHFPNRPVFLVAFDGHTYWANTMALERAGILHGRDVGVWSEIVMAEDGTATGELREPPAAQPVRDLLPQPDLARKRALLDRGLKQAAALGITSVHNMDGNQQAIDVYKMAEEEGALTLRVYVPFDVKPETEPDELEQAVAWRQTYSEGLVRCGAVKLFMDGVLESYTALMVDDYADEPGNRGAALFGQEHFDRMATAADKLGLQIFVHACGDGAVHRTLNGYEAARRVNGPRDSRHRVEHIEVIHPDDVPRFAPLSVLASMQPLHSPLHKEDSDVWVNRAGPQRWAYSFAWEDLRRAGAHLLYGSDWPVVSQNPMLGLYAGLNRHPWQEGDPVQRQTLENLIRGYTIDAAYGEFQENEKGMIRPGMLADLSLWSADLFNTPAEEMGDVTCELTVSDGRIVHRVIG